MPFKLADGHLMLCPACRGYKVSHGLSLCEVHLPIEIGSPRIFSRLSLAAPVVFQSHQYLLNNVCRAMTGYLHAVFTGVAVWSAVDGYHDVVDSCGCAFL